MNPSANIGSTAFRKLWKAPATQKARMTAWRALRNRLPTCDNLVNRNVELDTVERSCAACFHAVESAKHLFLRCPKSDAVWDVIQGWLGLYTVRPSAIEEHFMSFIHMGKGKKSRRFLKALWSCTIWVLWRRRNEGRFEGKAWEINSSCLEIKAIMWSWASIFDLFDWKDSFSSWCSSNLSSLLCN